MKTTFLRPVLDLDATGAKIKTLMKQRGISPRQLQLILNFPYVQTVYNWFAGKNMTTIDNLVVLAQILGVPMDEIVVTTMVEVDIEEEEGREVLSA
ncbi:Helix-turn-helix [Treponema bryantii]|uniref:Helix-turn-helix n=1 Tax=Treponema bryantii TaxID=163 RepID=A0A1H9DCE9_9SPIR|nr:helix-turn-helix transcriptional regulator [Treponema bryantii]SEQ11039.1 Helix-turn-helix [Treponema bryantii]